MRAMAEESRRDERGGAPPGRRLRGLAVWAFGCLAYWVVEVAAVLISTKNTWWTAARFALLGVLPDCLLAPLALWFTRRSPWGRLSPARFLARHAAGAAAFVALSSSGSMLEFLIEQRVKTGGWSGAPGFSALAWKGLGSLFVYVMICGIGNAVELARRAARAEGLRAEAQLAALRARLNPHFILNLLHTLMGLVARDPASAEAALERLGDVLRYALRVQSQGLDEVRLREEWDFVDRYLSLERLRLGDRLRSRLEADDDLLDAVVPAFSLQPLVENAVRHAIAPRAGGGSIVIRARRDGGSLTLSVEDDGAPPEAPASARASAPQPGAGIGLRLIRERLAALYGETARLETGRSALGGFRATVTLPFAGAVRGPA